MEWGGHDDLFAALPDDWERPPEPEMPPWAGSIWRAWSDLDGDRVMIPLGMGGVTPGRIPWTAIDRWAARHGLGGIDLDFFIRALGVMDAVMIERAQRTRNHHGG